MRCVIRKKARPRLYQLRLTGEIFTGQRAPKFVNVNKSLQLGYKQMKEFEAALSEGFYSTIQKTVVNMKKLKKSENDGSCSVQHRSYLFLCHVFVECLAN